MSDDTKLREVIEKLEQMLHGRRREYGEANLRRAPEIMRILWPDGIPPERYDELLTVVRVLDKIGRITTGYKFNRDAWMDIAGYAVCMMEVNDE